MNRDLPELLFNKYDLHEVFKSIIEKAREEVDSIPEKQFLFSNDNEVIEHVFSKLQVIPIELHEEAKQMEPQETKVDVRYDYNRIIRDKSQPFLIPGLEIIVSIPFSGDPLLWECQPSSYTLNPPRAYVKKAIGKDEYGYIQIVMSCPTDALKDGSEFKQHIEKTLGDIRSYLKTIKNEIDGHNQRIRTHIQQCVENRRQRLGKHAEIVKVLDIPLKRKSGAPDMTELPIKRRIIRPLPTTPSSPSELGIRDEDYEHILKVIRHEGRTFETTPRTYIKHDEEELRDIILAHLNGHYDGLATGETFRGTGKTDIRIEDQNRAAFVAECKIWRGKNELVEAINQLLGYLTWRDCKTALIIFNTQNAHFSEIQTKLPEIIQNHNKFINVINFKEQGEWRYKFRSLNDDERYIILHVLLFNLFVNKS